LPAPVCAQAPDAANSKMIGQRTWVVLLNL
jgi:hypothetical protein